MKDYVVILASGLRIDVPNVREVYVKDGVLVLLNNGQKLLAGFPLVNLMMWCPKVNNIEGFNETFER